MNITKIQVSANRAFPDPDDPKTTLRMGVCLEAALDQNDIAGACVDTLQASAETLVENHREKLVSSLENRRSIQHLNDTLSDIMDSTDEQCEEEKRLVKTIDKLEALPSIFNDEKPEPEREA